MNETTDQMIDRMDIERPGFRAEFERIMAANTQKAIGNEQAAKQWRERQRLKFTNLPFVGKRYRSRNRRSANKMTAWAVNPPANLGEGAALGADYAMAMMERLALSGTDADPDGWIGYGINLEAVVLGMADTLSTCKPETKDAHRAVIRGFCSVFECAGFVWLTSGRTVTDADKAATHTQRIAESATHCANTKDVHTRPWSIRRAQWALIRGEA